MQNLVKVRKTSRRFRFFSKTKSGQTLLGFTGVVRGFVGLVFATFTFSVNAVELVDVTETAGIDFRHESGRIGKLWTLEITGSGVAVFDYDNDGLLDLWFVQGGSLSDRKSDLPSDQIYRNTTEDGKLSFENVTRQVQVNSTGYGMGVAVGDIDNDGDYDVFVANFGGNQLWRNDGKTFANITDRLGSQGEDWSISASFGDYDGDGLVDLYVANYMKFPDLKRYEPCTRLSSRKSYCAPSNFEPVRDYLYRNKRNGTWESVGDSSGVSSFAQRGMGVAADDFNGDSLLDFYVANDMGENFLWINRGDGSFEDLGMVSGTAVNSHGRREASMGVTVGDYDKDGDPDIFITHDVKESNTLYENIEPTWFEDVSATRGVAAPSVAFTGFGTGWIDIENDGDLDLFIVNGSVSMIETQIAEDISPPLRQFNQLMLNDGYGQFTLVPGGPALELHEVSRGAAFGDLDNDGDVDIVVSNNDGLARIFQNQTNTSNVIANNWIGIQAIDLNRGKGDGVLVSLVSNTAERKRVSTDGSYASANDPRLIFGLGEDSSEKFVRVRWTDGVEQRYGPFKANRYHRIDRQRD